MQKHTLSVLVNNQPGVLARVAALFGRRGFNIDSITVGECEEQGCSRMIIVTTADDKTLEQVIRQLEKLIDVISVSTLSDKPMVAREIVLIKVEAGSSVRSEISGIAEPFRAVIVDVSHTAMTVQVTGDTDKNDALIELLRPYGILELTRTGITAMARGTAPARV